MLLYKENKDINHSIQKIQKITKELINKENNKWKACADNKGNNIGIKYNKIINSLEIIFGKDLHMILSIKNYFNKKEKKNNLNKKLKK